MPEEFNQVPEESWILLKQDDLEDEITECYVLTSDESECPRDLFAGIYCEESLEGNICWDSCVYEDSDGSINEDCILRQACFCDPDSDGDIPKWCDKCPNPSIADDTLPRWLRLTAQILGTVFEFHVVFLAIFPWWGLGVGLILVDVIFDYFWYLIFFAFCKPCAYIFVWLLNIPTIPLHVMYWYQRLMLELIGFIFDFWTLFFNGDGCFLRWGRDCWLAKRMKYRDNLTYTDLVFLTIKQPGAYPRGFVWADEQEKWYKDRRCCKHLNSRVATMPHAMTKSVQMATSRRQARWL